MLDILGGVPAGLTSPGAPAATPQDANAAAVIKALCWAFVHPVCNAMSGCQRKKVPTVAAFINTLLAPQLFVREMGVSVDPLLAPQLSGRECMGVVSTPCCFRSCLRGRWG